MKTIYTDAPAGQRVEGDVADVASQTGQPTPKLGGDLGDTIGTLDPPQDIEESALAISMDGDDISPDDAPEIMSEDDEECEKNALNPMLPLGHPKTAEKAIEARYVHELLQAFGALAVGKTKGGEKTPPMKVRQQRNKRAKKNKKKDKSLIQESILRMQTSKSYTGSSRTQAPNNEAEEFTGHTSLCDTPSASKHRPEEAQQGEEGPLLSVEVPLLQHDVKHTSVSVVDETYSAIPPPEGPTTIFAAPPVPPATGGHIADSDHHGVMSGRLAVPDRTPSSGSPEQLALIGGSESKSSPEGSVPNGSQFAVGGEALYDFYKLEQPDTNAPSLGGSDGNNPRTDFQWSQYGCSQVHLSEPAVVEGQIAEVCIESEQDLVDGSKHGHRSDQNIFDMKTNGGFDMDAEFSTPMAEDQFELRFGTTFHPHHYVCQPSPYSEGINELQDDIVLEDSIPECAEDSTMEDTEPETQEVAGIATVTRIVQLQSTPLVVPSSEYVSPSVVLPWPRVETPVFAFVDTTAPIFEPPMLRELRAPNSVALQGLVFPQTALRPDNAPVFVSDRVQSSTSGAEIDSVKYQEPVGFFKSPITALGDSASQAASCSSPSPPFPSPPRAVSTPASPPASTPIRTHIRDDQREIEGVDWTFDSAQGINVEVGIQRDSGGPKRPKSIDLGGQGQQRPSQKRPSIPLPPPTSLTSVPPIGPMLAIFQATASPTLIERSEHHDERDGDTLEAQPQKSVAAIVQPPTPPPSLPSLPTPHAAISKLGAPAPVVVVGFKRKFVDDNDPWDCSINPVRRTPHFPWLKRRKIGNSIHKRLGEVVSMSRQEREGTRLSDAIKLASRRHMPISPLLRPFAGNVANPGLEHFERNGKWSKEVWGESDRVTDIPSMNAQLSSFVLGRPCDPVSRQREKRRRDVV